jgi:outer membrane protein TolC
MIINAPVDSILGSTQELRYRNIELSLNTLKSLASRHRPLLIGWEAIKKQSILKVNLAKKDYWPDFSLFIAYTQRDELQNGNPGHDFLSGGISFNVPLYSGSKQSKRVEETQFSKNMIDDRYVQIVNQINFDLENTRSAIEKNKKLISLYKQEVLPQAEQSVESALIGYQTDKIDFLTLINNQITLFNYELDYFRSLSDYNKEIANLEYLVGTELFLIKSAHSDATHQNNHQEINN